MASTEQEANKGAEPKAMTPGQRLAAAKAAKAAKKASKRGRDAERVESAMLKKAAGAGAWFRENRPVLWGALLGIVVAIGGFATWSIVRARGAHGAAGVLWDATRAAEAKILDSTAPPPDDPDTETAPSDKARAERALRAYRKLIHAHPGTDAAVWGRIGQGTQLFDLGKMDDARRAFEEALHQGGDDPMVASRALEGIAFTYEASQAWSKAIPEIKKLSQLHGGTFKNLADYHLSRIYLAKGDKVKAEETLKALLARLRSESTDTDSAGNGAQPQLPYVQHQAEEMLRQIDASAVPHRAAPMGGPGGGNPASRLTPEQIEELIRRMQSKQGAHGAPGPHGAPPGGAPQ